MNEVENYVAEVLRNISAPPQERKRIQSDLTTHLNEAIAAGEPPKQVIARMGTPVEVASEFMGQMPLHYAGFWRRLAAYAIDLAIVAAAAGVFVIIAIVSINLVPRNPTGLDWLTGALLLALVASAALVVMGLFLLYFPILEGRYGQTAGKHLLGLKVLKENGLPAGYKEAFIRRLPFYFRILPIDALFIPFTDKRQRAFDLVARTIVVREA